MPIDFPTSPVVGEFYPPTISPSERQWVWNGEGWARLFNAGQGIAVLVVFRDVTTFSTLNPAISLTSFTYL